MIEFIKDYWKWIILLLVIIVITIITKKRGYFKKDKQGNKLSFKEFLGRWRKGVEGITPIQISKSQVAGNIIVLVGIISGIIINLLTRIQHQWYWITIVLLGSLILTSMSQVGYLQKYWKLKKIYDTMKELEDKELDKIICIICGVECDNGICDECLKNGNL